MKKPLASALGIFGVLLHCQALQAQDTSLILCGSGGTEAYREKFNSWGSRLAKALEEKMGQNPRAIRLLREGAASQNQKCTLENIQQTIHSLAQSHPPEGIFFVFLIGHGSYLDRVSKFQIQGTDLTAGQLRDWLEAVKAKTVVVINTTSASAGFINEFKKPNYVICTATRSVHEQNATEFAEYFIQSLEEDLADQNRDQRISVLEACEQAASLTAAWYSGNGLLATEHALLDDNGDGLGSRLALDPQELERIQDSQQMDGQRAAQIYLRDFQFPETVPQALIDEYMASLAQAEQIIGKKSKLTTEAYYRQLEKVLVKAAKIHRNIKQLSQNP